MTDEKSNDILAAVHDGAKEGAKEAQTRLRDRRLLIIFVFVVLAGVLAGDADARYRASENRTGLSRQFCDQQAAFKSLPKTFHLPPNADVTTRKVVASVLKIQASGTDLYVKFDCRSKVTGK